MKKKTKKPKAKSRIRFKNGSTIDFDQNLEDTMTKMHGDIIGLPVRFADDLGE